jgi:hypothetical protein
MYMLKTFDVNIVINEIKMLYLLWLSLLLR